MKATELAQTFGYMTVAEVNLLKACVLSLDKEPVLVNIGAGAGTSSLAMREAAPNAILYSVDKSPGGPLGGLEGERNAFAETGLALPIQILGDSAEAAQYYHYELGRPIDLLFVDDGHEETDVERDISTWMPFLKEGGVIAFHDYGAERWPAVKKVVDHYAIERRWRLYAGVDTFMAYRVFVND